MKIAEAITILGSAPLEFGNQKQIRASEHLERNAGRSNKQIDHWEKRRTEFVKLVIEELDLCLIGCPHCGRFPWMIPAKSKCGRMIAHEYGFDTMGRLFCETARDWFNERIGQGYILKLSPPPQ